MRLKAGVTLGNYEIIAPIGAGGMGEVYRARDTRLLREVAIKILPEAFALDADRLRRFEQEARAVSALNHPNVLSIFDVGSQDGTPYLVAELLQGESLRKLLARGPIPARRAVDYAQQIADGLAAAHDKKIVHRDLKPDNVFVTDGGRVKVLDFGLAKVAAHERGAAAGDVTVTVETGSSPGVVMGTTGYMAPEQVRGDVVDHRADIFSFGAVLYEMLSGNRAFHGETSIETLNAILKEDPADLNAELRVSPGLERIVRHCLEKKPVDRFQSARDLMFALSALSETGSQAQSRSLAVRRPGWRFLAVGTALLGAELLYWAWAVERRVAPVERAEFTIAVPGEVSHPALSRDGTWVAFVAAGAPDGSPMVWVQRVGTATARAIVDSEGASYPFWSPDNHYVAFFARGQLWKAPRSGSAPQSIASTAISPRGGSWGVKGVILFAPDAQGPLWRVNADGSGSAPATDGVLEPHDSSHRWPAFLPDGDHFLMLAGPLSETKDPSDAICLSSLSTSGKHRLVSVRSSGGYGEGRMYYVDGTGALVASSLDVSAGRLTGSPQLIAARTARSPSTYYASFSVSENATLIYSTGSAANHSQLTWFDEKGVESGRVGEVGVIANPSLSPDGKYAAWDANDLKANNVDVWLFDFARRSSRRFTFEPEEEVAPVWSRDGTTIAYRNAVYPAMKVELKKTSGLEPVKPLDSLDEPTIDIIPGSWSPDGRQILCTYFSTVLGRKSGKAIGSYELVLLQAGGGPPRPFLVGPANRMNGQISPDGKLVTYSSDEDQHGFWEVYVTTFPDAKAKFQVSHGGGAEPRWRGDGKAIFYTGPRQMLTEVAIFSEGGFSIGAVRDLLPIHLRPPNSSTDLWNYDVTRDGKRFLVNQAVKPDRAPPLHIVMHAADSPVN
jgi:serine/threonine protein kinase/Tol biopolymer transport system component